MARSVDQIIGELNSVYNPQIEQVNKQLAELPAYYQAQTEGLNVAKDNTFRDITGQASARGMVYSGMPIQEQARYTGEKYLPALAQLQQQKNEKTYGFQSQLTDIYGKRLSQAQALQQQELDREEQARQFELKRQDEERRFQQQLAAQRASASRSGGGGGGRAPSAADRMAAASREFAAALQRARQNPSSVQDGYREVVQQAVGQQYGLSPKDLGALSGQYFPNGWEWSNGIRKAG